jgi:hypothetical protein
MDGFFGVKKQWRLFGVRSIRSNPKLPILYHSGEDGGVVPQVVPHVVPERLSIPRCTTRMVSADLWWIRVGTEVPCNNAFSTYTHDSSD